MKWAIKKFLALAVAAILALVSIPTRVYAAPETITKSVTYVNPIYADYITEEELEQELAKRHSAESSAKSGLFYSTPPYTSVQQIGEYLRGVEKNRTEEVYVDFVLPASSLEDLFSKLSSAIDYAEIHTGSSAEGDYLRYSREGYHVSISVSISDGVYDGTVKYSFFYLASAAQEQQVTDKVNQVISSLSLSGKSTEEKIRAIYGYITGHVTYDYANLYNTGYKLKHSAYAALINGTSVCQGYALLFYRLCLEAGIDARIISGISFNDAHAWNIVRIGSLYYNLDSTWDSNFGNDSSKWEYYLKGSNSFPDHDRDDEYTTSSFNSSYPMSSKDYVAGSDNGEGSGSGGNNGGSSGGSGNGGSGSGESGGNGGSSSGESGGSGGSGSEDGDGSYKDCEWVFSKGKYYWYEGNVKQGTVDDPKGVYGDGTNRGREICDMKQRDDTGQQGVWFWLDSVYGGAKAEGKEVWIPYIYQNEGDWDDNRKREIANESDQGMGDLVYECMKNKTGKWVRYDNNGRMLKGWVTIEGELALAYPGQAGNKYYYDSRTGLMAKGVVTINGEEHEFDEITGVMIR